MRIALTLALLLLSTAAHATDYHWADRVFSESDERDPTKRHVRIGGDRHRYRQTHRHHRPHVHAHPATRVYSYEQRIYESGAIQGVRTQDRQRLYRDATSNVVCFPAMEALSVEANTEDGAWRDAQRNFENSARWRYGEKFMAISNARSVVKQCSRSSGNQSVTGKLMERVAESVGAEGFKHRCSIIAEPCAAPVSYDADVKGEK